MFHLTNNVFLTLAKLLQKSIAASFDGTQYDLETLYFALNEAPNIKMGHIAFPCFPLAKELRMGPPQISKKLEECLRNESFAGEAKAVGPYLNFILKPECYGENHLDLILNGTYLKNKLLQSPQRIMVEYSQPNTHKELHVGHMRNLCLGNAIVKILSKMGHKVLSATYPGDVGTHVAKCLWYLKSHNNEKAPEFEKGAWLGHIYTLANNKLEDDVGSEREEGNREKLTEILKQLEQQKGEYFDLWKETREWSLDLMNEAYEWADVHFDKWFFESEVDSPSLDFAKELYEDGKLIESEGAIGMDLSEEKLGFCMLIKSDGNGLYATKDIQLAYRKFEEDNLDKSYYVVDKRQAFHFKQVFKVLEKIGFPHAADCEHIDYDFVELKTGAMSSRKGNIVPLMDLIRLMEDKIKKDYLSKYENTWTKDEISSTATMVANGAIKYGMLRIDNNRKIVFDMEEWLRLDGETGPYLQYVHARINSLVEKLGPLPEKINWSVLTHERETELLMKLTFFDRILMGISDNLKTSTLCSYLYELGKLFNSFYADCPIKTAGSPELTLGRLALASSTGKVMEIGLNLLGIPAPKKM